MSIKITICWGYSTMTEILSNTVILVGICSKKHALSSLRQNG